MRGRRKRQKGGKEKKCEDEPWGVSLSRDAGVVRDRYVTGERDAH